MRKHHIFHALVLAAGGVVLAILIAQLGWEGIQRAVVGTGAWFAVIAAIDLLSASCDAFAIHGFLAPRQKVPYRTVFVAQLSGMAINRLTPGNSLGEPVKVTMLTRAVPGQLAVSAIVMFNITTTYVGIAAIVAGVPITLMLLDLPARLEVIVWVATGLLVLLAIAIAVLVRRGAVATLIDALAGPHLISKARAKRWRESIAEIDKHLRELGGDTKRSGLRRGLAGVIGSRVLNSAGTVAVLHAIDVPMTPVLVVAMLSVGILVTWASNIVPLGIGLADGTNYVLYDMLGAAPAQGLAFTMVTRLRTIVLAIMGLTIMALAHAVQRDRSRPRHPPR